ncbi:MAG: type II toxin-antitoxin system PemK/MazF family toxin [Ferruginibacter sp.]
MVINRFEVWLINLDPSVGKEIKKARPCMVISPDETNQWLETIIIIPMTSVIHGYPTRLNCTFKNKKGQLALDQLRAVDKSRLIKKLGVMDKSTSKETCKLLNELFEY